LISSNKRSNPLHPVHPRNPVKPSS
jgi:hypothetical protein